MVPTFSEIWAKRAHRKVLVGAEQHTLQKIAPYGLFTWLVFLCFTWRSWWWTGQSGNIFLQDRSNAKSVQSTVKLIVAVNLTASPAANVILASVWLELRLSPQTEFFSSCHVPFTEEDPFEEAAYFTRTEKTFGRFWWRFSRERHWPRQKLKKDSGRSEH